MIRTLRAAWRACPGGLVFCVIGSVAWLFLVALFAWNLAVNHFLTGALAGVVAAAGLLLLPASIRVWTRSPLALRAEFRSAMKPLKISEGLWAASAGDVLLGPGFRRGTRTLIVLPAQEFWDAKEHGGVYSVTTFLLPAIRPPVYRHVTGNRVRPGHPDDVSLLEAPGTRRQQAIQLWRAALRGQMDATPEEIETVLGQIKGATPIPGTEPPRHL